MFHSISQWLVELRSIHLFNSILRAVYRCQQFMRKQKTCRRGKNEHHLSLGRLHLFRVFTYKTTFSCRAVVVCVWIARSIPCFILSLFFYHCSFCLVKQKLLLYNVWIGSHLIHCVQLMSIPITIKWPGFDWNSFRFPLQWKCLTANETCVYIYPRMTKKIQRKGRGKQT